LIARWFRWALGEWDPPFVSSTFQPREESFLIGQRVAQLRLLAAEFPSGAIPCWEVPLLHFIRAVELSARRRTRFEQHLAALHVHGLLLAEGTGLPLLAVEWSATGWPRGKRQRGKSLCTALSGAGVPLLRLSEGMPPFSEHMAAALVEPYRQHSFVAPLCSSCGAATVLRQSRSGGSLRARFWGCRRFPTCGWTRAIPPKDDAS
jgi:hypothetical protein